MPIQLQSYTTKSLDPYKLLTDLRAIVTLVNKLEVGAGKQGDQIQIVARALEQVAADQGGSVTPGPPGPIGPFPAVYVDPNGAILGDGTAVSPLRVSVDGTTITIVGNQLTVIGGGGGSTYCEPLTDGDLTQPELIFALGDVIMVCTP
jgi:hypothetical protein